MKSKGTKPPQETPAQRKAHEKASKRAIERMQVARSTSGFEPNWEEISSSRSLSLREMLSVIYELFDRVNSQRPLPDRRDLIAQIESAMAAGNLEPNLVSLIEWSEQQDYTLFPPPTGTRGRYRNSVAANKVLLQRDAEQLVKECREQGKKIPTKPEIASELLKQEKYASLRGDVQTVSRILSATWK